MTYRHTHAQRDALAALAKGPADMHTIVKRIVWGASWKYGPVYPGAYELRRAIRRLVIDGRASVHNGVYRLHA